MVMTIDFGADRSDRLHAAGARAAGHAVVEILRGAEFALHRAPPQQIPRHRQHADHRRVPREAAARPHFFFGVGVPVVQREGEGRRSGVRRNRDEHALRGIASGEHETEGLARAYAGAEQLRALDLGRLGLGRGGRRRFGLGRGRRTTPLGEVGRDRGARQHRTQNEQNRGAHPRSIARRPRPAARATSRAAATRRPETRLQPRARAPRRSSRRPEPH